MDISPSGCRVQSELAIKKDDLLALLIEVPGYDKRLYINQAAIRWASDEEFGLEFIQIELNDRQRLNELVERNSRPA